MSGFQKTADPGDQLVSDEDIKSGSTMLNPMLLMKLYNRTGLKAIANILSRAWVKSC